MTSITTVEQLIESFNEAEQTDRASVLRKINIPKAEFERYISWKSGAYTRNCIARCEDFEFILLCWSAHAKSPIHAHGGQDCWVYQVEGDLLEKRYEELPNGKLQVKQEIDLCEGKLTFMNDLMGYHSIENSSDKGAITLHIYASPIDSCLIFNEDKSAFEILETKYDTTDEMVELN